MMRSKGIAALFATGLAACTLASAAIAADYPNKPVRIIVGFAAGSTADVLARLVGQRMSQSLGQQIVVENRAGAGSMLAANNVAQAPNDGYTLFMATVANTINPSLAANPTFNLARDLAPIALVGLIPNVLVVNPGVPASNVGELVALAKSKPDSITFSSPGAGTAGHLAAELFNLKAGTKLVVVQYQGGSPHAVADLVTGRTSAMFAVASTMVPQVKAGKLKALAVAQAKRAGIMPDVPTMVEAGMPGFDAPIWVGLLAPAGTPADVIKKLSGAVNEALKSEEVLGPMKAQGFDPMGGTPEELARYIEADIEKWNAVTAAAGIKK